MDIHIQARNIKDEEAYNNTSPFYRVYGRPFFHYLAFSHEAFFLFAEGGFEHRVLEKEEKSTDSTSELSMSRDERWLIRHQTWPDRRYSFLETFRAKYRPKGQG